MEKPVEHFITIQKGSVDEMKRKLMEYVRSLQETNTLAAAPAVRPEESFVKIQDGYPYFTATMGVLEGLRKSRLDRVVREYLGRHYSTLNC